MNRELEDKEGEMEALVREEWDELMDEESSRLDGMVEEVTAKIPSKKRSRGPFPYLIELKVRLNRLMDKLSPLQLLMAGGGLATALTLGLVFGLFFTLGPRKAGTDRVIFMLPAPKAKSVSVAGTFSGWKQIPLQDKDGDGVWKVSMDLEKGRYRYGYLINGKKWWGHDPSADEHVKSFRGVDSIRYIDMKEGNLEEKKEGGVST